MNENFHYHFILLNNDSVVISLQNPTFNRLLIAYRLFHRISTRTRNKDDASGGDDPFREKSLNL